MARPNGGIIGPDNVPTPFTAKGTWKLSDAFNYIKAGLWPTVLGYQIPNSCRFNSGSSDYLSRTQSSTGNRQIFTISMWAKRSVLGSTYDHFLWSSNDPASGNYSSLLFSGDAFRYYDYGGSLTHDVITTQLFRDVSAWYHVIVAVDTTQATSSNRVKMYVNGSQITSFSTATYPSLNYNTFANLSGYGTQVGFQINGTYYNGYLSEVYLIDGQQLTPSSFGETDSTTGIWTSKAYTGTYGTNGFYLKFANSAALGTDSSGNGNTFTVNNLTSVDQSTDTPTNNFCTWNPLNKFSASTLTDGSLTYTTSGTSQYEPAQCTIGFSAGKWYSEHKVNSIGATALFLGIYKTSLSGDSQSSMDTGRFAYNLQGGNIVKNASDIQTGLATFTTNDILGIAVDMTNGTIKFYKNGSQVGTTITDSDITNNEWTFGTQPRLCGYSSNFGSPPYSVTGGYTDAGGFGNFSYQPPSGYYALCTRTLAALG
jgi:hypothetical protein